MCFALLFCVGLQTAFAQFGQPYGGVYTSEKIVGPGGSSDIADTLYIGPGTHVIDGVWEIYSKYVVIDQSAVFTSNPGFTGTIQFYDPVSSGLATFYTGATILDGNALTNALDINIEVMNANGLQLAELTFGPDVLTAPGSTFADNTTSSTLYIGQDLNLAVDGADITLGTGVAGDLVLDASATISNYGPSRMVIVNNSILSHMVKEGFTTAFTFPVGIADGDYTPAEITNASANTVHVSVQDYAASISPEDLVDGVDPSDGMDRTWHVFGNTAGTGTTLNFQHNTITNQTAFLNTNHFVTQWGPTTPNASGDISVPFSTSPWQNNTFGPGTLGTLFVTGSGAGSNMRSRTYTALATSALAEESYFSKSSDLFHPLPVNLVGFTAQAKGCDVSLQWTSGVETNMKSFRLMHSANGSNYTAVATLPAKGNNSTYSFVHTQATQGTNIYRLELVEADNSYTVSPTVKVTTDCQKTDGPLVVNVYPNPTQGSVIVSGLGSNTQSKILLLNLQGQVLKTIITSNDVEMMDLTEMAAASYMIKVIQGDNIKLNQKVVRQ